MNPLTDFLGSRPVDRGLIRISAERPYQHEEAAYDQQYGVDKFDTAALAVEARNAFEFCKAQGLPPDAPVLEIGCGTGRMSIGLAMQEGMGPLLITDPSPAFCRIVQDKLKDVQVQARSVDIAVLSAEDVALLPPGSVSLILLRSVLHHIADVEGFIRSCAQVLPTGGLLVCEEPYYEGYMMMGFIGQFIEDALANAGYSCTDVDRERIRDLTATMQFYCRRDIDKSAAEDKHLFRPDDLMVSGRAVNLELSHFPNWRFTASREQNEQGYATHFYRFFAAYIEYCMSWPPEFSRRVADASRKYFEFFTPLETGGQTTPHCFGTFVFRKR